MRRRGFLTALGGAALAAPFAEPFAALAQQPPGIPRIGVLMGGTPSVEAARPRRVSRWARKARFR